MTFDNCGQAYAAGYANMHAGTFGYTKKLDRDGDGVACETPPPGFTPHQTQSTAGVQSDPGGQLPTTGPATGLTAAGVGLLVLGVSITALIRRRRTRFTA